MSLPSLTPVSREFEFEFVCEGDSPGERDNGEVDVRGECRVVKAAEVTPDFAVEEVAIARGFEIVATVCVFEDMFVECVGCEDETEVACPVFRAECARKAERKLERKGRFVGILLALHCGCGSCG